MSINRDRSTQIVYVFLIVFAFQAELFAFFALPDRQQVNVSSDGDSDDHQHTVMTHCGL